MPNRLTAIIPCKDEELNIGQCVESVRGLADEILVADSGSTDRTLQIVRELGGCRVIRREYVGPADFKNWAIPQAAHPWVLCVDADERVTPELAAEIRRLLAGEPERDAYRVRFAPYFLGFRIRHCGWNTTSAVRLMRRDLCRYDNRLVHEDVVVPSGKVGRLQGKFLHFTCRSLSRWLEKQNRYTTWAAREMFAAGRRVGFLGLIFRPLGRFLKFYLARGGMFDGTAGLVVCLDAAIYTFLKYAKLWEMQAAARSASSAQSPLSPCGKDTSPTRKRGSDNDLPALARRAGVADAAPDRPGA